MVLMRLESAHGERTPMDQMKDEQFFQTLTSRMETLFGPSALAGRYSVNSIIYFVPELDQTECLRIVRELLEDERFGGLDASAGIATHPFLDYTRSDTLDNARKALDHAGFLQGEKMACFDSISLNISADRLFAQGEIYDAIAEYKKALTLDEGNLLARNSLGVCYARLNKYAAARTIFQELVARHPDQVMPMNRLVINLGRGVDAHEGQRFLVWSRKFNGREAIVGGQGDVVFGHYPPMYKAEVSLVEVQDEMAIAEILVHSDPDWIVEKGDRLTLLDDHSSLMEQRETRPGDRSPQKDPLTGLYPYRDFLQTWQLSLIHI
jgi:tetratricopeptide (TPR) repeat protein